MRAIRSEGTSPELNVRSLCHKLGYRFRLHRKDIAGRPDLTFPSRKTVIFVHGCFWHGHGCKLSHAPRSNTEYWTTKIARNMARDRDVSATLAEQGWHVRVIWECETKGGDEELAALIHRLLR